MLCSLSRRLFSRMRLTDEIAPGCKPDSRCCTSPICSTVRPNRVTSLAGSGVSTDSNRSRSARTSGGSVAVALVPAWKTSAYLCQSLIGSLAVASVASSRLRSRRPRGHRGRSRTSASPLSYPLRAAAQTLCPSSAFAARRSWLLTMAMGLNSERMPAVTPRSLALLTWPISQM